MQTNTEQSIWCIAMYISLTTTYHEAPHRHFISLQDDWPRSKVVACDKALAARVAAEVTTRMDGFLRNQLWWLRLLAILDICDMYRGAAVSSSFIISSD